MKRIATIDAAGTTGASASFTVEIALAEIGAVSTRDGKGCVQSHGEIGDCINMREPGRVPVGGGIEDTRAALVVVGRYAFDPETALLLAAAIEAAAKMAQRVAASRPSAEAVVAAAASRRGRWRKAGQP